MSDFGLIRINNPSGDSVVVTITDQYDANPTVTADHAGTSQDNPATITDTQEFHVGRPGNYTVAMTVNGLAAGGGSVFLDAGVEAEFEPGVSQDILAGSAGGGGGGSEPSIPIADNSGPAVVDTTTYDNTITGTGKLTTLVIPATENGGLTAALAIAVEGDAFPRVLLTTAAEGSSALMIGDGTGDLANGGDGLSIYNTGVTGNGVTTDFSGPGGTFQSDDNGLELSAFLGKLIVTGIPTEDPAVANAVYNDSGVLKISAG